MIDLYFWHTSNGRKISIMLEEVGLPYKLHSINIGKGDQFTPEYVAINPNSKIPAIVDPEGPDGKPITIFESGAILIYLADKTGKFMPTVPRARYETLQWLFFQVGHIGPMFGQVGFFHKFAGREYEDKRPLHRYRDESIRLLGVLEKRLGDRPWLMGDEYSIADVQTFPWVRNMRGFYDAGELLGLHDFPRTYEWVDRAAARTIPQLRLRLRAARTQAPKAPTAPASVGVARPVKMLPSTAKISTRGGTTATIICRASAVPRKVRASGGKAGTFSGWTMATKMI